MLDMIGGELNPMSGGPNRLFPERLPRCGRRKGKGENKRDERQNKNPVEIGVIE